MSSPLTPSYFRPQETRSIYAGRTPDGDKVAIRISLRVTTQPTLSVYHEPVAQHSPVLSISGDVWRRHVGMHRNPTGWGQVVDTFALVRQDRAHAATGALAGELSRSDRLFLLRMWREYHLNDMQAACAHQEGVRHDQIDWQAERTFGCPQGYRYGSRWLYRPIPAEDLLRLSEIVNRFARTTESESGS